LDKAITVSDKIYCNTYSGSSGRTNVVTPTTPETLNINALIPSLSMTGTQLTSSTSSLTNGSYFYNGNYILPNDYIIPTGQSVTIYVNGDFTVNKHITGGNIVIYATGNIIMNSGASIQPNGTAKIYALGTVGLSNPTFGGLGSEVVAIGGTPGSITLNSGSKVAGIYTN